MHDSRLTDGPAAFPGVDGTHHGLTFQPRDLLSSPDAQGGLGSGPRVSCPPSLCSSFRATPTPIGQEPHREEPHREEPHQAGAQAHSRPFSHLPPSPWAGRTPCGCSQALDV